jgi:hypothetical protein
MFAPTMDSTEQQSPPREPRFAENNIAVRRWDRRRCCRCRAIRICRTTISFESPACTESRSQALRREDVLPGLLKLAARRNCPAIVMRLIPVSGLKLSGPGSTVVFQCARSTLPDRNEAGIPHLRHRAVWTAVARGPRPPRHRALEQTGFVQMGLFSEPGARFRTTDSR